MTRQRNTPASGGPAGLRGAHVHLHVDNPARDYTMIRNRVLRNQFRGRDGGPLQLRGLDRAVLHHLLSFGWDRADDTAWRLDMDRFVGDFTESRSTVYGALQRLEEHGFLVRLRLNDAETGRFEWHWSVTDQPGALDDELAAEPAAVPAQRRSGGRPNPQVAPRSENPNMAAEQDGNRRSGHGAPRSETPDVAPCPGNPNMAGLDADTSYREVLSIPPTSHNATEAVPADRATTGGWTEGRKSSSNTAPAAAAPLAPPPSGPVGRRHRDRTADEVGQEPTQQWLEFVSSLMIRPEIRGKFVLRRPDQILVALRCQRAHDHLGWTVDRLTNRMLSSLFDVQHLAGVWLQRLHPDELPVIARAETAPAAVPTVRVPLDADRSVPGGDRPSAERIGEIRQQHGGHRGSRWSELATG